MRSLRSWAVALRLTASLLAMAGTVSAQPTTGWRWDALPAGAPAEEHLFSREHSAGFLRRPGSLTPDTWFHDGHLRTYALLNLGDVVRTAEISRGRGPVFMFGNARRPQLLEEVSGTFDHPQYPKRDAAVSVREMLGSVNCQGMIVVRNGKIVFEEYAGMDPGQRHHWMSISKSTLNILLGKLVGEGKIDLTKRVDAYLPELEDRGYGSPQSSFWAFGRSLGWFGEDGKWPGGNRQFLATLTRLPKPEGEDGRRVRYTSSNSQVLAWVVERVTGRPYVEVFEQEVWQRIGAVAPASVTVDKQGFPSVGGGFSSSLRDLARYGLIWAQRGVAPDGTRIFPAAWMTENTSGKGPLLAEHHYHNQSYSKDGAIVHQGHSGQMLWVRPESGTIVATFGSTTTPEGGHPWTRPAYLWVAEAIERRLREREIAARE
jgi:CubicO group peptidase (beta-lactamase class C family)